MRPEETYVLIGCEESQALVIQFRALGFIAFSCDIKSCTGGHPEWHLQCSVFTALEIRKWHLFIAHPPCQYLSYAGMAYWNSPGRKELREEAFLFFMALVNADCDYIAIENPRGYPHKAYRMPDQVIHPYYFGDNAMKRTSIRVKNLPLLVHTHVLPKPEPISVTPRRNSGRLKNRYFTDSLRKAADRSKTFPGIAAAVQWGMFLTDRDLYQILY